MWVVRDVALETMEWQLKKSLGTTSLNSVKIVLSDFMRSLEKKNSEIHTHQTVCVTNLNVTTADADSHNLKE